MLVPVHTDKQTLHETNIQIEGVAVGASYGISPGPYSVSQHYSKSTFEIGYG